MRRIEHIIAVTVIHALALLLVAMPAYTQLPDTLHLAPCHLAGLSRSVEIGSETQWTYRTYDYPTLSRIVAPLDMQELDKIGESLAPEPLIGFAADVLTALRKDSNATRFPESHWKAVIALRYPDYDVEYDFDAELMGQAFAIGRDIHKRVGHSAIVMAPLAGSPGDSVPLLITFITWGESAVEAIHVLDESLPTSDDVGVVQRTSVIVQEAFVHWRGSMDSMAVATWIENAHIDGASLYRLPLREAIRRGFADDWIMMLQRVLVNMPSDLGSVDRMIFVTLLDSLGTDTTYTPDALAASVKHLVCSRYDELDCEYGFDFGFSDSAKWKNVTRIFRRIHSIYLSLPSRIYTVVEGENVIAFLSLPVDTSRTALVTRTREEIDRVARDNSDDWHDRLMRSIRQEECWAERMEGF